MHFITNKSFPTLLQSMAIKGVNVIVMYKQYNCGLFLFVLFFNYFAEPIKNVMMFQKSIYVKIVNG